MYIYPIALFFSLLLSPTSKKLKGLHPAHPLGPCCTCLHGWWTASAHAAGVMVWGFDILVLLPSFYRASRTDQSDSGWSAPAPRSLWSVPEALQKRREQRGFQIPGLLHWLHGWWQLITYAGKYSRDWSGGRVLVHLFIFFWNGKHFNPIN